MKKIHRAIAGRIRIELQELNQVAERATRIWQQAMTSTDFQTMPYVDATALNLQVFTLA